MSKCLKLPSIRKRNKRAKQGKEPDPTSTRLEELRPTVPGAEMRGTPGSGANRTRPYPQSRPDRTVPHQPTSEECRLMGENDGLRRQLQQKHGECLSVERDLARVKEDLARVKEDLASEKAELRRKEREIEDWIPRQRQQDKIIKTQQKAEREIHEKLHQKQNEFGLLQIELQKQQNAVADKKQELSQSKIDIRTRDRKIDALEKKLQGKVNMFDVAQNVIKEKETELRRVREELDKERNNKMAPRHNQGEEIDEKLSRLQSVTVRLDQELQEERRELGLKDKTHQQVEEALRQKDDEIAQMKHELNATASRLQSETAILDQKLQEATRELELKDKNNQQMEEALRQKHDEIAQMKHELYTTKQSLERESERVSKTEHELRQYGEEKDKEAKRASEDIGYLTEQINALQHKLSATDECLEQMRNGTKQTEEILKQRERELYNLNVAFETEYQQWQSHAEAERETLKTEYHFLKADRDALETERDSLETKVDSLRAERDSLQRHYTEAKAVAEDFQHRLSKEFSIRLASDETNMENISVKHRPAKIAEKFAQIESKEWVEAKEVLDDTCDEKTSICLLLNMLQFACECAREVFDGFLTSEAYRLYSPIAAITTTFLAEQHQNAGDSLPVPGSILKEITAFLKGTCGECDIESLTQSVVNRLKELHGEDIVPILQDTNVRAFLQACCRIAWQMAVQQPPLAVVTSNTRYDEGCHQLWYNSPPPSRSKGVSRGEIDFYIWPELRQAEKVLHRGRVCLKPSE